MITLTHADLTNPPTRDECLQNLLDFLELQGFSATSWKKGDPIYDLLNAVADRDADKAAAVAFMARNRHNATATDEKMMERIAGDYGNTRAQAVAARHLESFTLVSGEDDIDVEVGVLVVAKAGGRITYRNIQAGVIPSGGSVTLEIEAEVAGTSGNTMGPGEINQMVSTLAGVSCTNIGTTRFGRDAEQIEDLRLRNTQRWPTLSLENTAAKVEYTIKTAVPNITSVVVDGTNPRGLGTVDIYCAQADRTAQPADLTAATAAARALFFDPDPRIQVLPAIEMSWNPTGTILCDPAFQLEDVQFAVIEKLTALLSALPIGARSYSNYGQTRVLMRDDVIVAVRSAAGVVAFTLDSDSDLTVPKFYKLTPPTVWNFIYSTTEVS